jgi:dTDP-4-dehydrorhamnose reductase
MSKLLIVGEHGELANDLRNHFGEQHNVYVTSRVRSSHSLYMNLEDEDFRNEFDCPKVDFAIFAAGITGESNCRNSPRRAEIVNVVNTKKALEKLSKQAKRVYFISSSLCFDISQTSFYDSLYLDQKRRVEDFIISNLDNVFIVRPSKVFGFKNQRLHEWVQNARAEKVSKVPSNIKSAPTSTCMLGNAIQSHYALSDKKFIHISSTRLATYFEIALELLRQIGISGNIEETFVGNIHSQDSEKFVQQAILDMSALNLIPESLDQVIAFFLSQFEDLQ